MRKLYSNLKSNNQQLHPQPGPQFLLVISWPFPPPSTPQKVPFQSQDHPIWRKTHGVMVGAYDVGGGWCFGMYHHNHSSVWLNSLLRRRPTSYTCSWPLFVVIRLLVIKIFFSFCCTGGGWHSGMYLHDHSSIQIDSWLRRMPMSYPFSQPSVCNDATTNH